MTTFKLKPRPVPPVRKVDQEYRIEDYNSVQDIIVWADKYGVTSPEHIEAHYYYESTSFRIRGREPADEFEARLTSYEERLKDWQAWYDKNSPQIGAELARREVIRARREEEELLARAQRNADERVRLEKERARIDARLAKIK